MFFRISSARGADLGPVFIDTDGLYIGDSVQTFGQGTLLNFDSEFTGRANMRSHNIVPLIRVRDTNGLVLGTEKSLGDLYHESTLRTTLNQISAPDFDVAISFADADSIQRLDHGDEIEVHCLVVNDGTMFHPHIQYLVLDGEYYSITSNLNGSPTYTRGNALPILVQRI